MLAAMTRPQILDLHFLDARSKLIDIAAFLDRLDRADGRADFRLDGFQAAVRELSGPGPDRARRVLLTLSDPTSEPVAAATGKGAVGAFRSAQA
jgi:hypothetical protein